MNHLASRIRPRMKARRDAEMMRMNDPSRTFISHAFLFSRAHASSVVIIRRVSVKKLSIIWPRIPTILESIKITGDIYKHVNAGRHCLALYEEDD